MMEVAARIKQTQEYYFSRKLKEVRALAAAGHPIINMGIGSPDLSAPEQVINALKESLADPIVHQYQSYIGIPELRESIAHFYKRMYSVTVNPLSEVLPLMGSKEGIMHLSMAFLNPGDEVLIPNPGYPTYSAVAKLVGASSRTYDLHAENDWLPDLKTLAQQDLSRVKLMWVNYPHMPTGAQGSHAFFEDLIAFAKAHKILLINDNPYSFVLNDRPESLLQIEGAKEVAMELNSLSKTFNMAGWRVGMLLGNEDHIQAVLKVKSNMDSGMFLGIQRGAIAAMVVNDDWFRTMNKIYGRRRELVYELASILNCTVDKGKVGMFVWAKLPEGIDEEEFINEVLHKQYIFITPGTVFGSRGKGYIRFSLCLSEDKIREAIQRF